jgi:hypothetical protein
MLKRLPKNLSFDKGSALENLFVNPLESNHSFSGPCRGSNTVDSIPHSRPSSNQSRNTLAVLPKFGLLETYAIRLGVLILNVHVNKHGIQTQTIFQIRPEEHW